MGKLVFLFPGQGSQYVGMGKELAESYAVARAVLAEADEALGFPLSRLCLAGPEEELRLTANTQPAVLTVSVAAARVLEEKGVRPDYVAGHSLGEYSALVVSGCLALQEAVVTVKRRGQYMQEAVPAGAGAMAAILGLPQAQVEEVCRRTAQDQVVALANLNSPAQIVISGHAEAVNRAVEAAKGAGAKRAILLPVSAPFHCALLRPAARHLERDLFKVEFEELKVPLVTNVDAEIVAAPEAARDALMRQVCAPVRWEESMRRLIGLGCDRFIEVGPGKVLRGLLRQIDRGVACTNVEDQESLDATLTKLAATKSEATP
ncbi:MAG: ACP S-malonyltransferase [Terriglobia bacterium]